MRPVPKQQIGLEIHELLLNNTNIVYGMTRFHKDGPDALLQLRKIEPRQPDASLPRGWNKINIFFDLPYWKHLKIRHNLDVMHIEKNVCDNILSTLLQDRVKSKDGINARKDLQQMNIRLDLHAKDLENDKFEMPASKITMSKSEMQQFCNVLKSVKSPDGYSSNISNNVKVKERQIINLKTHDNHILLHQLIPVALRGNIDDAAAKVLMEFCGFFNKLCSKVVDVSEFEKMEADFVITLCNMKMLFPPSFFTIIVYLTIHLAREAIIAGPV